MPGQSLIISAGRARQTQGRSGRFGRERTACVARLASLTHTAKKILKHDELERERAQIKFGAVPSATPPPVSERVEMDLLESAKNVAAVEESSSSTLPPSDAANAVAELEASSKPEAFAIPNEIVVKRLRGKNQPVRLFGESDRERRLRLRALELIEERDVRGGNDFRKTLEGLEAGLTLEAIVAKRAVGTPPAASPKASTPAVASPSETPDAERPAKESGDLPVDLSLLKTAPARIYPLIYYHFKKVLREWEQSMEERPDSVKRSAQGKQASAIQKQSEEYLKPLFKSLRKREYEADLLKSLAEIAYYMQVRQYVKANDAYLRLSIGNSAWPIGVTSVGIHMRSARERITEGGSHSIAHVLNDEVSRKWIQSLKRLMTYAQSVRPPTDRAQAMG